MASKDQQKKFDLNDAYSVVTPEDNKNLYRNWANTYDTDFAQQRGYQYPDRLADIHAEYQRIEDAPILDVGAGTGLVAQAIKSKGFDGEIDAIDISSEMLEKSQSKGLYQKYIQADLTQTLPIVDEQYGALLSVGTFTQGHVGPQVFEELLRIARSEALFCIGINARFFDKKGFGSAFAMLQANNKITTVEFIKTPYYRCDSDSDTLDKHANDFGLTAVFRKI